MFFNWECLIEVVCVYFVLFYWGRGGVGGVQAKHNNLQSIALH